MDDADRASAEQVRRLLVSAQLPQDAFRAGLTSVRPAVRDAWLDVVLGLDDFLAEDGPELPRGCVPYVPCSVDTLLRMIDHAGVQAADLFVDVGSGAGRAAALVHLLTGASAVGLEIQPGLVRAARDLAARVNMSRVSAVEGDATLLTGSIMIGSIFFLYCPFSGDRLERVLDDLEAIARTREVRVCCVDLPLPHRPWLELVSPPHGDLAVHRSTLLDPPAHQPSENALGPQGILPDRPRS
ncbi:MAG TPA: class I SAM-dependent methyltransferase [Polyangiaceae bacterium]|nr:class I SAM-dependent methyltransferase [Polyangiaceae bacterium]